MSLLFCHDHRFFVDANGRIYSYGQFDRTVLDRYVRIFGSVTIAARGQHLTPTDDLSRLSPCSSENVKFLWMPSLSSINGLTIGRPAARQKLERAVLAHDAVIARLPSEIGMMALSLARARGKPAGAEVVACVWDGLASHGSPMSLAYAPIAWWRMRRAVAKTGRVLYVTSEFLQSRYPSYGAQAVASNVEIPAPDPHTLDERLRHIASERKPVVFGMIAALFHKEKGIDVAIRAFAEVRRHVRDIELWILGPGDPASWQEVAEHFRVADAVTFHGTLPRGEPVLRWLDGIDVYVQASFQEGLPRALIEALSRGCPALASSAGGTAELVAPDALHKPSDWKRLAGQMTVALNRGWQERNARLNFERSKSYVKTHLDQVRQNFWSEL